MEDGALLVLLPLGEVVERLERAWETVQGKLSKTYLKRRPVSGEHAVILEIWEAPGILHNARPMVSLALHSGNEGAFLDPGVSPGNAVAKALCTEWIGTFQAALPDPELIWIYSDWQRLRGEPLKTVTSLTFDADIADFDCAMRDALREYERRGYVVDREAGAGFVLFRVSFQGQRLLDLEIARTSAGMLETQALAVSDAAAGRAGLLDKARELANGTEKAMRHFEGLLEPARAEARRLEAEAKITEAIVSDPGAERKKYGTCRDLSENDVKAIVRRCRQHTERGGKVPDFWEAQGFADGEPRSYELETLKGWLKKFK